MVSHITGNGYVAGGGFGGVINGQNNINGIFINVKSLFGKDIKDLNISQLYFINVLRFYEEMNSEFYLKEADNIKGKRYCYKEEEGEYIYYDDYLIYNKCLYFRNKIIEFRNKSKNK